MTEQSGRRKSQPATVDGSCFDGRLRELTEDAERLIPLSVRPSDVRWRAHRRQSRRRAGAAIVAGGATLAIAAVWGVLPSAGNRGDVPAVARQDQALVSAAALLPPAEADGKLTEKALLSPSALPWNDTYHWRVTGADPTPSTPPSETGTEGCRLRWFEDLDTEDVVARTYAGGRRATAQHRIAAFPGSSDATKSADALIARLRQCGWHQTRVSGSPSSRGDASPDRTPAGLHEYVLTSTDDPVRVTLVQSDNRMAVLAVSTPVVYDHAHPDHLTDACLDQSLRQTRPGKESEHC
ncbi:hypothetical protein ABZ038_12775 [Streptomyces sp. NPDC006349]|uniref:hypothetical protein n=1 Tax=Streptomyces sp. NPDC006349 TaxID=3156757 RepID=UPI0006B8FE75|nr:hypothetical protein ADL35_32820 [Streptomyces sp. NRRL WC-3753]